MEAPTGVAQQRQNTTGSFDAPRRTSTDRRSCREALFENALPSSSAVQWASPWRNAFHQRLIEAEAGGALQRIVLTQVVTVARYIRRTGSQTARPISSMR